MLNQAQDVPPKLYSEPPRRMNILILDDNEVDRKRLLRLCGDAGLDFSATEAASVREFQNALETASFDLVFIDYLLAGEDGLDAVNVLIRDTTQSAVSIMIAGEGRLDIAVEAMRRGCSDYLTKSGLSVEMLQKSVATALERRIMNLSLHNERDRRLKLELAVRHYANSCSMEMRTILAATLRRVRKLRSHKVSGDYAQQLGELEKGIDQLWDALPSLGDTTDLISTAADTPNQIEKH